VNAEIIPMSERDGRFAAIRRRLASLEEIIAKERERGRDQRFLPDLLQLRAELLAYLPDEDM